MVIIWSDNTHSPAHSYLNTLAISVGNWNTIPLAINYGFAVVGDMKQHRVWSSDYNDHYADVSESNPHLTKSSDTNV